jgi:uncharacterized protein
LTGFLPGKHPIDGYFAGGFHFAGMAHSGSLLVLPDGLHGWAAVAVESLSLEDFAPVFAPRADIDFLLLGTGREMLRPPRAVREAFALAALPLDFMATGPAISTYNLLLGERRKVAAALIAAQRL